MHLSGFTEQLFACLADSDDGNALIACNAESWDAKIIQVFALQLGIANKLPSGLTEI